MVAEIHQLRQKPAAIHWMCSSCGVDAGCNCGAPLMSKRDRINEYDGINPGKSTRQVAEALGDSVNAMDVSRARRSSPVTDVTPNEVVGKDGKSYPARRMPTHRDDDDDDFEAATPSDRRSSFLIFSNEALLMAQYAGPIDNDVLSAAKATAAAWSRLVEIMEQGK